MDPAAAQTPLCPVCREPFDPAVPPATSTKRGRKRVDLCSDQCKRAFDAAPERYLALLRVV